MLSWKVGKESLVLDPTFGPYSQGLHGRSEKMILIVVVYACFTSQNGKYRLLTTPSVMEYLTLD